MEITYTVTVIDSEEKALFYDWEEVKKYVLVRLRRPCTVTAEPMLPLSAETIGDTRVVAFSGGLVRGLVRWFRASKDILIQECYVNVDYYKQHPFVFREADDEGGYYHGLETLSGERVPITIADAWFLHKCGIFRHPPVIEDVYGNRYTVTKDTT